MDPITSAIISSVSLGIFSGITTVSQKAIIDFYNLLKLKLLQKYRSTSSIINYMVALELNPNSENDKKELENEIKKIDATNDIEIVNLSNQLLEAITKNHDTKQTQIITGNSNTQIIGNNNRLHSDKSNK